MTPEPEPREDDLTFAQVRDVAVQVARTALFLEPAVLQRAIEHGEAALDSGVIDPIDIGANVEELRAQVEFLRAFRNFRLALEDFAAPSEVGS